MKSTFRVSRSILFTLLIWLLPVTGLRADEDLFGYLQTALTEHKGEFEVVQWTTARVGKERGRYLGMDFSTELEYGFTHNLQGALYLNGNYHLLSGAAGGRDVFADANRGGLSGAAAELKYKIADPYRDPIGLALYFEPGYNTIDRITGTRFDEWEIELRMIAQKNFFNGRLVTVFNYIVEQEFERESGAWEHELVMEWLLGASWRLNDHLRVGLEARLHTQFKDDNFNDSEFLALHLGPSILYSTERFFASLTVLPQVAGWPDARGTGGLHLDEVERLEVRLKVGLEF